MKGSFFSGRSGAPKVSLGGKSAKSESKEEVGDDPDPRWFSIAALSYDGRLLLPLLSYCGYKANKGFPRSLLFDNAEQHRHALEPCFTSASSCCGAVFLRVGTADYLHVVAKSQPP
jgi:hypothetical protein